MPDFEDELEEPDESLEPLLEFGEELLDEDDEDDDALRLSFR